MARGLAFALLSIGSMSPTRLSLSKVASLQCRFRFTRRGHLRSRHLNLQKVVRCTKGGHAQLTNAVVTPRAQPALSTMTNWLLVRAEKVVVSGIRHELRLTHRADGGRNSSAGSVQTLDEGGLEQEVTARGPLLVPHRLQQEALNRTAMRATRGVGACVDSVHPYRPHPAAIEGTLPRRVPTQRGDNARLRVFIDALEVSDDLELLPEEIRKESGFGAGGGVPGSATSARGQTSIALRTEGMADQVWRVSRLNCNSVRGRRGRDLRCRVSDRAECTCEHENGREQDPNSRSLVVFLIKVVAHLFVLQFCV